MHFIECPAIVIIIIIIIIITTQIVTRCRGTVGLQ